MEMNHYDFYIASLHDARDQISCLADGDLKSLLTSRVRKIEDRYVNAIKRISTECAEDFIAVEQVLKNIKN